ncbi:hypothetical protein BHAP_2149 [Bifidobacterium hapali]|uniref:DUF805 domain-containing protein n=2 Tax=Bifidobacterium hapali TaxID=1630172 RepID=A0A261FSK0_9BIFI|nr:hypothetical protein BHAP_2149 [Bifidobacterium hapali]
MTTDSNPFISQPDDASAQSDASAGRPYAVHQPAGYPSRTDYPPYGQSSGQQYDQSYGSGNPYTNPYGQPSAQPTTRPPLWAPWYGINFGHAVARFLRKAFVFHGRASRGEYWWGMLFIMLLSFAVGFLTVAATDLAGIDIDSALSDNIANIASTVLQILIFIPDMSLSVRRLHDENLSGWWVLLPMVTTIMSAVATLVVLVTGSGDQAAQTMVIAMLVFFGSELLTILLSVILMILPSNPAGARFDRPPVTQ